ncbi:MAG: hypothetical protein KF874_07610 [Rhizobiaceae bacterium]|nr:hypothetical protein [Rhizobiaceae bacterium]
MADLTGIRPANVRASLAIGAHLLWACASPAYAQQTDCRQAEPVNTLEATGQALGRCWQAPPNSAGLEVTVRLALRSDGTLYGEPRITWLKRNGTEAQRRAFVAAVFRALDAALPIPFTESMGRIAAGRPMAIRFSSSDPNEKTL